MKKIISLSLFASSVLSANPYVGIKATGNFVNLKAKISGQSAHLFQSSPSNNVLQDYLKDMALKPTPISLGILGGYAFNICDCSAISVELDAGYSNVQEERKLVSVDNQNRLALLRENLFVKRGFDFGVSSYFNWKHNKTFTTLWGVRLGGTQYEVKASHTNSNGITIDPLNRATKKSFVLGIEPTVGFMANMNDCFAFRATIGYRFSQKKTMVDNYLKSATMIARNNTAKVSLQPNGIILAAALIKKF